MDWLNDMICFRTGEPCSLRGSKAEPWKLDIDGEPWAFATDGRFAVYVRGESEFAPTPERLAETSRRYARLTREQSGEPLPVTALREFAGVPTFTSIVPCPDCGGTGTDTCPHCEREGDCGNCEGTGKARSSYKRRPVRLLGNIADGNQLAFVLGHVPDGCETLLVRWHVEELPHQGDTAILLLACPGWLALLTHLDPDRGTDSVPEFGVPTGVTP